MCMQWTVYSRTCFVMSFLTHLRNENRDITHCLLSEVCHDITLEPVLRPLEGHNVICICNHWGQHWNKHSGQGFLGNFSPLHFLLWMFLILTHHPTGSSPSAPVLPITNKSSDGFMNNTSMSSSSPHSLHLHVFSTTGGIGKLAAVFIKHLANMISANNFSWTQ